MSVKRILYLSYFMDERTPLYGGGKGVFVTPDRSIANGDTANTKQLALHNHSGTHIDFPNHFFAEGATSEAYDAEYWIFAHPYLIQKEFSENEIILFDQNELKKIPVDTDFLIIKTGFGRYRSEEQYCKYNPGLSPELADQLRAHLPVLRVLGVDLISINAFQNRELGREAHRKFLGGNNPILLVEDMDLSILNTHPASLTCLPLLIKGLDGAPVTIIASL